MTFLFRFYKQRSPIEDLGGKTSEAPMTSYTGVEKLNDSLYDFKTCVPGEEKAVVIFFHGIAIDDARKKDIHFSTWTFENSNELWPKKLFEEDQKLQVENKFVIRALAAVYDSSKYTTATEGRLDAHNIKELFVHMIIPELVKKRGTREIPIVIVAHSFGGIIVKEMIDEAFHKARKERNSNSVKCKLFFKNLGGIFFYATPHRALEEATFNQLFPVSQGKRSPLVELLSEHNKSLARNEDQFNKLLEALAYKAQLHEGSRAVEVQDVHESLPIQLGKFQGTIVTEASAVSGASNTHTVLQNSDHFTICKPPLEGALTSDRYINLQKFIGEKILGLEI